MTQRGKQRQEGSETTFDPQVSNTNGDKKDAEKISQKQIRKDKYKRRIGVIKPKPKMDERGFMTSCHCNGSGTCSFCVQKRRAEIAAKTNMLPKYYVDVEESDTYSDSVDDDFLANKFGRDR
jgi:hypothetical protein